MWAQLASEYEYAAEFLKAEDAYNKSLHLLKTAPSAQAEYAGTLESLATLYLLYGHVDEAESVRKQALAVHKKLGDRFNIGLSQIHLANIAIARRQFKKAERLSLRGMEEDGVFLQPSQGRDTFWIDYSHVCTLLARAL